MGDVVVPMPGGPGAAVPAGSPLRSDPRRPAPLPFGAGGFRRRNAGRPAGPACPAQLLRSCGTRQTTQQRRPTGGATVLRSPAGRGHFEASKRQKTPPARGGRAEAFTARVFTLAECGTGLCHRGAGTWSRRRNAGGARLFQDLTRTPALICRRSGEKI